MSNDNPVVVSVNFTRLLLLGADANALDPVDVILTTWPKLSLPVSSVLSLRYGKVTCVVNAKSVIDVESKSIGRLYMYTVLMPGAPTVM